MTSTTVDHLLVSSTSDSVQSPQPHPHASGHDAGARQRHGRHVSAHVKNHHCPRRSPDGWSALKIWPAKNAPAPFPALRQISRQNRCHHHRGRGGRIRNELCVTRLSRREVHASQENQHRMRRRGWTLRWHSHFSPFPARTNYPIRYGPGTHGSYWVTRVIEHLAVPLLGRTSPHRSAFRGFTSNLGTGSRRVRSDAGANPSESSVHLRASCAPRANDTTMD